MSELDRLKDMNNKIFIPGRCFLCGKTEEMDPTAYCHYPCALAKTIKKEEITAEFWREEKEKKNGKAKG